MKSTEPKTQDATEPEAVEAPAKSGGLPFDPLRVIDALIRRWRRILIAGLICAGVALGGSLLRFRNEYQASVHLIRQEPPNAFSASETGETFKPRTLAVQTLVSIIRSPGLVKRVSEASDPVLSPGQVLSGLTLVPERNTDLIRLEFKTSASANLAAVVLNSYANGVVELTRHMQAEEAASVNVFLQEQLKRSDAELEAINAEMLAYGREVNLLNADKEFDAYLRKQSELDLKYETTRIDYETIGLRIASTETELKKHDAGASKLKLAQDELTTLLSKFTESNPLVQEQRSKIAALTQQNESNHDESGNASSVGAGGVADSLVLELVLLRAKQKTLQEQVVKLNEVRDGVAKQLNALPEKQLHFARIQSRKTSLENARTMLDSRQREAALFSDKALGYYRVLTPVKVGEVAIVSRNKKVMLFSIVGLLGGMGLLAAWSIREAFDGRITTALDLRRATGLPVLAMLPASITRMTMQEAWAFRMWTALRSRLGVTDRGGVLGVLSREPGLAMMWLDLFGDAASRRGQRVIVVGHCVRAGVVALSEVLENPLLVLDLLDEKNPLTVAIDANFVWTANQRARWHAATQMWLSRTSAVIMLEIIAPGEPESVLLCERLPEVMLLASSGANAQADLSDLVAPYREAGCHLTGVALHAAPALRPAWLATKLQSMLTVLLAMCALSHSFAAPPAPAAARYLAKPLWLQPYLLGPGDGFNIGVYGHTELLRNDVFVGADGRLTYLHANILAAGLTVDELRAKLNAEMGKFYQHSQVIVSPMKYASKRIFVLGKVVNKGAILLDRPLTVLEAIAEAGGLETGLFQLNTIELADLPRSLLVRKGQRLPCDFEKLFNEGDMSFNFLLEPDDFIYLPSSNSNEFHVFGAVKNPGTQALTPIASVISAISIAGDFSQKAWRKRVLVVRGSLTKPECFIVNVEDILAGRGKDMRMQPHDIIYVADRPWAKVEELLQVAINTFAQAATASWTGANVGPLITSPFIPQR